MTKEQEDELVKEFQQVTQEYEKMESEHRRRIAYVIQRRRDIAQELVYNNGAVRPRTHMEVAKLLGISGPRVGQLVKESSKYEQQQPPTAA